MHPFRKLVYYCQNFIANTQVLTQRLMRWVRLRSNNRTVNDSLTYLNNHQPMLHINFALLHAEGIFGRAFRQLATWRRKKAKPWNTYVDTYWTDARLTPEIFPLHVARWTVNQHVREMLLAQRLMVICDGRCIFTWHIFTGNNMAARAGGREFREKLVEKAHTNIIETGRLAQQLTKSSKSREVSWVVGRSLFVCLLVHVSLLSSDDITVNKDFREPRRKHCELQWGKCFSVIAMFWSYPWSLVPAPGIYTFFFDSMFIPFIFGWRLNNSNLYSEVILFLKHVFTTTNWRVLSRLLLDNLL